MLGIGEYVIIPTDGEFKEYVNLRSFDKTNKLNVRVKALVRLLRDYKEVKIFHM